MKGERTVENQVLPACRRRIMRGMRRYLHGEMHRRLLEACLSARYRQEEWIATQAFACPYFVPLRGVLGADWGVIVNPASGRFGLLTFEHDDCGCPGGDDRHVGDPDQDGDMWLDGWVAGG